MHIVFCFPKSLFPDRLQNTWVSRACQGSLRGRKTAWHWRVITFPPLERKKADEARITERMRKSSAVKERQALYRDHMPSQSMI